MFRSFSFNLSEDLPLELNVVENGRAELRSVLHGPNPRKIFQFLDIIPDRIERVLNGFSFPNGRLPN